MISHLMVSVELWSPSMSPPSRGLGLVFLLLLWGVSLGGCAEPARGAQRLPVKGTVLQQGQPMPAGSISFLPIEGTSGPAANTSITQGKYQFTQANGPVAGRHRVVIALVPAKPDLTQAGQVLPTVPSSSPSHWEFVETLRDSNSSFRKDFQLQ